ncbi:imidazoleglycerol-phosphate dehydratase [Caldanaerobius fijiensis DSM 17918]|uniref:Imidazoleglycerol-phosphate dehydratase n=1 Tax=Caldanaerobius fijiensis DSM 17918 TaxID=1121256 RepID=A0A1M5B7A9_9THEO|nr:imidazoleglycerol-phosphate dehydratase HisB [Caldanaerobius fijiensis]SHF38296.1 imidazoleglycerol-phosphate dehydratase [Caldanaerobius fijiensis DSM 17918]
MRKAELNRETLETQIYIELNLDGKGSSDISTGIGFFDHMLILFSKHGLFDLKIVAKGDLNVDSHHTIEDVGITMGKAFNTALRDKVGITRYGSVYLPMDEALVRVVVDISGRPFLHYDVSFTAERIGEMDTKMVEEFMRAFAFNAGITLHMDLLHGSNNHHIAEACFKGLGRALRYAVSLDEREAGLPTTKGVL